MPAPLPDPPDRITLEPGPELRRRVRRIATHEHRTESAQFLWFVEEGVRRFESLNTDRAQVAALGEK